MVAHIIRILIFILIPFTVVGQSLSLSVTSSTNNNDTSTFLLDGEKISVDSNNFQFLNSGTTVNGYEAFGISPGHEVVGILERTGKKGNISIYNSKGEQLNELSTVTLGDDDPSMAVFPSDNGEVLLRDNITNFTFYDTFGEIENSMSNSSQTEGGEAISETARSKNNKTVVIYSPKIKRGNNLGSKAQVKMADGSFENIFRSTDRFLRDLTLSKDGNIVVAITAQEGTDDQVVIMDKYGNELNSISTGETLKGASIASDNRHVTLYSSGRVMVHSLLDGESLGASSSNSTIFTAEYFPQDDLILALAGNFSEQSGVLNNIEFRAINLQQRSITSEDLSGSLGFSDALKPELIRTSANEYQLRGANKRVMIEAHF